MFTVDYLNDSQRKRMSHDLSENYMDSRPLSFDKYICCTITEKAIQTSNSLPNKGKYIFLGYFLSIWGHCITDNLKKLWFLYSDIFNKEYKDYKLCYKALSSKNQLPQNFGQLLNSLGVNINDIEPVNENWIFEELIVPKDSVYIDGDYRFYHMEMKSLINHITLPTQPVRKHYPEKIYFSRTKLKQRFRDYGEIYIENAFRQMGFTIVYPERLSFEEQLLYLRNCKVFAATEGSIAHNAQFCCPGTKQVIIRKSQMYCSYQFYIIHMTEADTTYIDSNISFWEVDNPWSGPFLMYCSDNLVKFAKEEYGVTLKSQISLLDVMKYSFVCLAKMIKGHSIKRVYSCKEIIHAFS